MHVTYYDGNWRICYRYRNGYGVFGPIETVSSVFSFRPDVIEDSLGRPHVVYPGEVVKDVNNDLFEAVKENGVWTTTRITYSDGSMEDEPKLGLDQTGRIHLIYTKGNDVMYRVKTNDTWSGELAVGTCQNTYYHRPDLSIDPSGNLHVVWADNNHVYYRKCTSGVWGAVQTIMSSSDFIAFPKIAATTASQVVAVTFDQRYNGHLEFTYSNDGGNVWTGQQYLVAGHWRNMDTDGQGNAYLNVRAINGAQMSGPIASSDGIQIQTDANPTAFTTASALSSSAYSCDNAMLARVTDGGLCLVYQNALDSGYSNSKVVYRKKAGGGSWGALEDVTTGHVAFTSAGVDGSDDIMQIVNAGSGWYVENSDRSAGIRVDSSASVTPGDVVTISGTISTVSGERRIVCPG